MNQAIDVGGKRYTLGQWYGALGAAIRADDVEAVPGLLRLMALDGYGHEAERWRRETARAVKIIREARNAQP